MARDAYLDSAQDTSLYLLVDEYISVNDPDRTECPKFPEWRITIFSGLSRMAGAYGREPR